MPKFTGHLVFCLVNYWTRCNNMTFQVPGMICINISEDGCVLIKNKLLSCMSNCVIRKKCLSHTHAIHYRYMGFTSLLHVSVCLCVCVCASILVCVNRSHLTLIQALSNRYSKGMVKVKARASAAN